VPDFRLERLSWTDVELGTIALPHAPMRLVSGFGSGLTRRRSDPPDRLWAVGDRGPNIKVKTAVERYGLSHLAGLAERSGAKIMPRPDTGPAIAELRINGDRVELVRALALSGPDGRAVSGLPPASSGPLKSEPAFDLDGRPLPPDPGGLDTEGIAALADGGFWVTDEFGPSVVRLDSGGRVLRRLVPEGVTLAAPYSVEPILPALAARRKLNRGFEAIAVSRDERSLFVAFRAAWHVRLWQLDPERGAVMAQYLYPLDPPESFARDSEKGDFKRSDIKVSEIAPLPSGDLLVVERGSETTKIYRAALSPALGLGAEHLDVATRPSVEELSCADAPFSLPVLAKRLLFSSDEAPDLAADIEGIAVLDDRELVLVSDNDFGVEGAQTSFWRLRLPPGALG
jgi:hypothetical protein